MKLAPRANSTRWLVQLTYRPIIARSCKRGIRKQPINDAFLRIHMQKYRIKTITTSRGVLAVARLFVTDNRMTLSFSVDLKVKYVRKISL